MLKEAEEMAEQDKAAKERVTSRNELENLVYSVRNQLNDEEKGIKGKLAEDEVETIESAIKETISWLEEHLMAEKSDFEEKKKEFESIIHPIFSKYSGAAGGPGGPGGPGGFESDEMPSHDDL